MTLWLSESTCPTVRVTPCIDSNPDFLCHSHELYIYNNTLDMYTNFAPKLNGRYLSSNVNITVPAGHGNAVSVPVGERFRKFKTQKYVSF